MNIYLVRHGEAVPHGSAVALDADRPLSSKGEEDALAVGCALAAIDPEISTILTSPLLRAADTGTIIAKQFNGRAAVRASVNLAPGFSHKALLEELLALGSSAHVVAVCHQPDIGAFLSFLIADTSRAAVAFTPGSVAAVTLTPTGSQIEAQLRWLLTPELAAVLLLHPEQRRQT